MSISKYLSRKTSFRIIYSLAIGLVMFNVSFGQSTTPSGIDGVTLHLVSQEEFVDYKELKKEERRFQCLRDLDEHSMIGGYDVIVGGKDDDLKIIFRLENNSKNTVYYLFDPHNRKPIGYVLFKQKEDKEWSATSPAREQSASLTGFGFQWKELSAGASVEFYFTDLSTRKGQHAVSIFINRKPEHKDRIELISNPYRPIQKNGEEQGLACKTAIFS